MNAVVSIDSNYQAGDKDPEVHNRRTLGYSEFRLKVFSAAELFVNVGNPICKSTSLYGGVLDS